MSNENDSTVKPQACNEKHISTKVLNLKFIVESSSFDPIVVV